MNYQLRTNFKNRGHFPNDEAAIKLLWLAVESSRVVYGSSVSVSPE